MNTPRLATLAVLSALSCTPAGRSAIGNTASLTPVAPSWLENDPDDFVVELGQAGYLAVFQHRRGPGPSTLSLVYASTDTARQRFDIALASEERPARVPFSSSEPRVKRECIGAAPVDRSDTTGRFQQTCAWRLVAPEARWSPRERSTVTHYVILAFAVPVALDALVASGAAVPAGRSPADVAAALGQRLFGERADARWAATIQFVP